MLTPDINNHSFKLVSLIEKEIEGKVDYMRKKKYEIGINKHLIEYDKYFLSIYYILDMVLAIRVGNGYPLQYSCLENPMDRVCWRATVYRVAESWTQLSIH